MKLATFDLEIAKEIPEDANDWKQYAPLGITCAAVALDNGKTHFWHQANQMSKTEAAELVHDLKELVGQGYNLVTWNGCSFDFNVLAQESGLLDACADLAMKHTDLMLLVTFVKGHYLGLDKALSGAGIKGKVKTLTLTDGSLVTEMSGQLAPSLWQKGEFDAVLTYLRGDVEQLLELAKHVEHKKEIRWISNRGNPQLAVLPGLIPVEECFSIPEPDTSWMTDPPSRLDFIKWMGKSKNDNFLS